MCVNIFIVFWIIIFVRVYFNRIPLAGLRNDHKALMKKIEEGLHKVHALAEGSKAQDPASNVSDSQETEMLEPFLRVNLVSSGSPAEIAVCYRFVFIYINLTNNLAFLIYLFVAEIYILFNVLKVRNISYH